MTSYVFKNEIPNDAKNICVFCTYLHTPKLPNYILHYITSLKKVGYETIVISHSDIPGKDLERLAKICCAIVVKANVGYDFFAWKFGMGLFENLPNIENLLLANDSIIGPFRDLAGIFKKMTAEYDFWGLTENNEYKYHIQSYFLHANKRTIRSEKWINFWKELVIYDNKLDMVRNYEVELTQTLLSDKAIRIGAWVSQDKLLAKFPPGQYLNYPRTNHWHGISNPTIKHWKELLLYFDFPFIKKNLFFEKEHYHFVFEKQVYEYKVFPVNWKNAITKSYGADNIHLIQEYVDDILSSKCSDQKTTSSRYKILFIYDCVTSSPQIDYLVRWIQYYNRNNAETELIVDSKPTLRTVFDHKLMDITTVQILSELTREEQERIKHRLSQENIGTIIIGDPASAKLAQFFSYTNAPHLLISEEPVSSKNASPDYNFGLHSPLVVSPIFRHDYGGQHALAADPVQVIVPRSRHENNEEVSVLTFLGLSDFRNQRKQIESLVETLRDRKVNISVRLLFNADEYKEFQQLVKSELALLNYLTFDLNATIFTYDNLGDYFKKSSPEIIISFISDAYLPEEYIQCFLHGRLMLLQKNNAINNILTEKNTNCQFEFFKVEKMAEALERLLSNPQTRETSLNQQVLNFHSYIKKLSGVNYDELLFKQLIDFSELRKKDPIVTVIFHFHFYSFDEVSFSSYKKRLRAFYKSNVNYLFSITEDSYDIAKHVASLKYAFPNSIIKIVPNKGRDIGAKFLLFDYVIKSGKGSEFLVVLHDKKSLHLPYWEAKLWIDSLLKIIDPANYETVLSLFQENEKVGIVGSAERISDCIVRWSDNNGLKSPVFEWNNDLLHKMIVKYNIDITDYNFVGGTMFWIKTDLLKKLDDEYHFIEQYKLLEEGNVMDNAGSTVTHSWERLLCWLSTNRGYRISKI